MSDSDIEAAYTYLMTRTSVHYSPPENDLFLPLRFRPMLAFWNLLYLHPGTRPEISAKDPQVERGRYLVDSLGHCAGCHSALNPIGGEANPAFGGGHVDGWDAPALTELEDSALHWTEGQLANYLRTGLSLEHGAAKGPMRAVTERLAEVQGEDVDAIAKYVMSIQVKGGAPTTAPLSTRSIEPNRRGTALFASACASCHSASASMTVSAKRPNLALSSSVVGKNPDNFIQTLLGGIPWNTPSGNIYMPPFKDSLTNEQIADIAQYVRVEIGKQTAWSDLEGHIFHLRKEMQP